MEPFDHSTGILMEMGCGFMPKDEGRRMKDEPVIGGRILIFGTWEIRDKR
jgi:hypothetical protein